MTNAAPLSIGQDDYLADAPDTPLWNEAMAVMIADAATGITACLYVSRWWREPTVLRHMISIMLPGDRALFSRNYGRSPDGRLASIAGLTMQPLGDGRIRYTFDGPMDDRTQSETSQHGLGTGPTERVRFDLIFSSDLPVWELKSPGGHADTLFPGGHAEQLGQTNGLIHIGDETHELKDASTCRDHSRGVRNWSTHHSHVWLNAQFESGWGFCSFRSSTVGQAGYSLNAGVLFKDGESFPATIETEGLIRPGSDIWAPFDIRLVPQGHDPIEMHVARMWNCGQFGVYAPGDLYWGVPTGAPDPRAFWTLEQSGEYHALGEVGTGRVERCHSEILVDDHWRGMCTPEKIAGR